jgi:uncharacterized protein YlxW (UPF0749 family)
MPVPGDEEMANGKRYAWLSLTLLSMVLGLLLVVQLRTQRDIRQSAMSTDWEYVVAELIDNNAHLRNEVAVLEAELDALREAGGSGVVLESLVDEVNRLRIVNGLIGVSGPGIEIEISGPVSVLDLNDLINELRNAGAEALALNGRRLVAWSAIGSDGLHVIVDGQPIQPPYRLEAVGDRHTLRVALERPGGLLSLLQQTDQSIAILLNERDQVTLPLYDQPLQFVYAELAE